MASTGINATLKLNTTPDIVIIGHIYQLHY